MADVLLARSDGIEGFERHVVIKRIRAELARDPRFIRMFLDEARVVATLHHQNIVQVHDIGEVDGEYFIAMEYVHGEDVRKILSSAVRQNTHVPLGHAVAIVAAAAAGLHYAHERMGSDRRPLGIVHRDVSPSNILVGYDGSIKIVDFGIATASAQEETRSGNLKGKLAYMSPEQCKGITVDRRSDVYGLGVVLYEFATTTPMIRGASDFLVMEQIVQGRIAPPERRRPGLPVELQDIIMRALATDRERRYATADDLRIALDEFATNAGLTASTSSIAAFMQRQFGQPPEPWLVLDGQPMTLDDASPYHEESRTWIESPSGEAAPQSAPLAVIASDGAPGLATAPSAPKPPVVTALQSTQIPTDSRMGWESVPRPAHLRGSLVRKAAVVAGAMVAGIAIWLATRSASGPVTQMAAPTVAQVTLPVAAAMPVTPRPPDAIAPPTTAQPRNPEPTTRSTAGVAAVATSPQRAKVAAAASQRAEVAATASPERADVAARASLQPGAAAATESPQRAETASPQRAEVVATSSPRADLAATASQRAEVAHPESSAQRKQRTAITTRPTARSALAAAPSASAPEAAAARPLVAAPPSTALAILQQPTRVAPTAGVSPSPGAELARIVSPPVFDANRIAGDRQIVPDELTMAAIGRSGRETVVTLLKVCVAADGRVNTVAQLRSTGFPAYDTKIQDTIRRDWRYRPHVVDGKAVSVCTAFKLVYSQK